MLAACFTPSGTMRPAEHAVAWMRSMCDHGQVNGNSFPQVMTTAAV